MPKQIMFLPEHASLLSSIKQYERGVIMSSSVIFNLLTAVQFNYVSCIDKEVIEELSSD